MPDIFLEYGLDNNGEFTHISQVGRGRVDLTCPYCGVKLIARKGERVAAHFAHDGETCNAASRSISIIALPLFDKFNLHISGTMLERFEAWVRRADKQKNGLWERDHYLLENGLIEYKKIKGYWGYAIAEKGMIVLGRLPLGAFNKVQEALIAQRHDELLERARIAQETPARIARIAAINSELEAIPRTWPPDDYDEYQSRTTRKRTLEAERRELQKFDNGVDPQTALTDLRLYRLQWQRVLSNALYFLEVTHDSGRLHKIGVTTRHIEERLQEIKADLKPLVGDAKIKVLNTWKNRGNVELYFKFRYANQRATLGLLTEYFQFNETAPITRDLSGMEDKVLTELELEVLRGEKPILEREIETAQIEQKRRDAIRAGMHRSAGRGEVIGRPRRTEPETADEILSRSYAAKVIKALESGLSLRDAAKSADVSVNTVRKVKQAMEENEPLI